MDSQTETPCRNPATGDLLGYVPQDTGEQVRAAIEQGRAAQRNWGETPVKERARCILRVRDYVVEHAEQLCQTIQQDNGKTRMDALSAEIVPAAMAANYYARHARRFLRSESPWPSSLMLANKRSRIRRVPWGVVGVISPWNYPFSIPFSEVVMALLAGNAVILKVATETQMVGRSLAECFSAVGLPEGVFSHVRLPGRMAGPALLQGGVDKLFFTGSVAVGKQLMAQAAATLTPLCLELGGNDPMLVCPDADLERAAAGAVWAGMSNCGQSCAAVERIYVHSRVYPRFLELLRQKVSALRVGEGVDGQVDLGAMTTASQCDTVRRHIQDALDRGAVIHAQSQCPTEGVGHFLPATVLTHVDHTMLVMREETFGPVVAVAEVAEMHEGIRLANDSNFGLTASVWSRDRRSARQLAEQLRAGVVTINDHLMSHGLAETPWGGWKDSGWGRTHGAVGFAEMTQTQCIVDDWLPGVRRNLWWHPHDRDAYRGLSGLLDLLYARRWSKRIAGLRQLLRIAPRVFRK